MDEGSRRTSEARLAAEALLSQSITRSSSSLNAINYGFVAFICFYVTVVILALLRLPSVFSFISILFSFMLYANCIFVLNLSLFLFK